MELSLSKQQAFELSAFLRVQSKKFASVTEARKAASTRKIFEDATQDYSKFYEDLSKKNAESIKEYQEKYTVYAGTAVDGKLPSKEEQQIKAVEMDKELQAVLKTYQDQAQEYSNTEGQVMIAVTLDKNYASFLKSYFEKEAVHFNMWQDGAKLEEMAQLIDSIK